ncbi:hypothetical protein CDAR_415111 [Caerostris darwini]|uniref:Uncharacterized protein n=1 Tax=Caerostris darwini TaxID=1538125 RepID=A0AAV4TKB0_9ARAC|nr:hypothetical protein CDAR_415111 [Caerostris darwini]
MMSVIVIWIPNKVLITKDHNCWVFTFGGKAALHPSSLAQFCFSKARSFVTHETTRMLFWSSTVRSRRSLPNRITFLCFSRKSPLSVPVENKYTIRIQRSLFSI